MKYIGNFLSGNRYMAHNWHGLRDQIHICTRLRRDVSQLSINASFFKLPLTRSRREIWIGNILLFFFHFICTINDILLKTVKNNIAACLCNAFYTNLSLWNTTRRHLPCVVRMQTSTRICQVLLLISL